MITLHHLEHSRSLRILWALEELGLEYEVKRSSSSMSSPARLLLELELEPELDIGVVVGC